MNKLLILKPFFIFILLFKSTSAESIVALICLGFIIKGLLILTISLSIYELPDFNPTLNF